MLVLQRLTRVTQLFKTRRAPATKTSRHEFWWNSTQKNVVLLSRPASHHPSWLHQMFPSFIFPPFITEPSLPAPVLTSPHCSPWSLICFPFSPVIPVPHILVFFCLLVCFLSSAPCFNLTNPTECCFSSSFQQWCWAEWSHSGVLPHQPGHVHSGQRAVTTYCYYGYCNSLGIKSPNRPIGPGLQGSWSRSIPLWVGTHRKQMTVHRTASSKWLHSPTLYSIALWGTAELTTTQVMQFIDFSSYPWRALTRSFPTSSSSWCMPQHTDQLIPDAAFSVPALQPNCSQPSARSLVWHRMINEQTVMSVTG